jgi:hypothetical protein
MKFNAYSIRYKYVSYNNELTFNNNILYGIIRIQPNGLRRYNELIIVVPDNWSDVYTTDISVYKDDKQLDSKLYILRVMTVTDYDKLVKRSFNLCKSGKQAMLDFEKKQLGKVLYVIQPAGFEPAIKKEINNDNT